MSPRKDAESFDFTAWRRTVPVSHISLLRMTERINLHVRVSGSSTADEIKTARCKTRNVLERYCINRFFILIPFLDSIREATASKVINSGMAVLAIVLSSSHINVF